MGGAFPGMTVTAVHVNDKYTEEHESNKDQTWWN